jgi:hypothetical protein
MQNWFMSIDEPEENFEEIEEFDCLEDQLDYLLDLDSQEESEDEE